MSFEVTQGRMSGNLMLKVRIQSQVPPTLSGVSSDDLGVGLGPDQPPAVNISQDLCLYQSDVSKKGLTHQVTSTIIKAPDSDQ